MLPQLQSCQQLLPQVLAGLRLLVPPQLLLWPAAQLQPSWPLTQLASGQGAQPASGLPVAWLPSYPQQAGWHCHGQQLLLMIR